MNAIVHLHSHYISVLSSVERPVGMYNVVSVLFHEEQATYADDGVKSHLAVVDALGDKHVVLMKNHGAIVASDSLENATIEATEETEIGVKETIAFDAAYDGERMHGYLFLPKHGSPPYQTVVFFPAAFSSRHMRKPPINALRLLPSEQSGGSFSSFFALPPPSTTWLLARTAGSGTSRHQQRGVDI